MKRFAIAAVVLGACWISISVGQVIDAPDRGLERGDLIVDPKNPPEAHPAIASRPAGASKVSGILSELKVGQTIRLTLTSEHPFSITVIDREGGETTDQYRERLRAADEKRAKEYDAADAELKEALESQRTASNAEERLTVQNTVRRLAERLQGMQRRTRAAERIYEITEIHSNYLKVSQGDAVYCIPARSISYIRINKPAG